MKSGLFVPVFLSPGMFVQFEKLTKVTNVRPPRYKAHYEKDVWNTINTQLPMQSSGQDSGLDICGVRV